MQVHPLEFFSVLNWLDGRPLMDVIELYRARIFEQALYTFDDDGRPRYNMVLGGRAKKNWKTADLILAALYRLIAWESEAGNQCYCLANDEDQAGDDLAIAKKLIEVNPVLGADVRVKQKIIEREDGKGFLEILPAGDVVGSHGKTYSFAGFDEIHGYRTWDLLEAMQLDPTRPDAMMWITSYASIFHKPGVPLFDLMALGKKGTDPRMFFSWYAADHVTDPNLADASAEDKANPSRGSMVADYLEQQRTRLPSHKYRRLHLNLPGLPEGSAFTCEMVMDAVERGVRIRSHSEAASYGAFVDMSGGSSDDAVLAIAHCDESGRGVLDVLVDQGQRPPFDPMKAVGRFALVLNEWGIKQVTGDRYAGETFRAAFQDKGITYKVSGLTKHEIYEALEPRLNGSQVVLLDHAEMESQLLSLVWRGNKIDHPGGEHDDFANAAAGAIDLVMGKVTKTAKDYAHVMRKGEPETVYTVAPDTVDSDENAFFKSLVDPSPAEVMMTKINEIMAGVEEGKPVDWESLDPEVSSYVERQLRKTERELKIHGYRETAALFRTQLDRRPT